MDFQRRSLKKPLSRTGDCFLVRLLRGLLIVPFVFCMAHLLTARIVNGQEDSVDEYKLKAAMLYNLTHFVEWPDSAYPNRHAPIFLCILGRDPFASSLTSTLPKDTGDGRPVIIRQLQSDKDIPGCHVLYISTSERRTAARIFSTMNGSSILTVGEISQFAAHGGIIQFSMEDEHVRFHINLDAATRAKIKISSKLLALAQIVRD